MKSNFIFVAIIIIILSLTSCSPVIMQKSENNDDGITIEEPTESSLDEYYLSSYNTSSHEKETKTVSNNSKGNSSTEINEKNIYYIGNSNSKKFHKSSCGYTNNIKDSNIVKSNDRQKLIDSGYVPCKSCQP